MFFTGGDNAHHQGMKQPLEASDAEFPVAYCIDTVARIENAVGSLDTPFGKDKYTWL